MKLHRTRRQAASQGGPCDDVISGPVGGCGIVVALLALKRGTAGNGDSLGCIRLPPWAVFRMLVFAESSGLGYLVLFLYIAGLACQCLTELIQR